MTSAHPLRSRDGRRRRFDAAGRRLPSSDLAAATPAGRDRVIDFLRSASLLIVVLGHWLMATVVVADDGTVSAANALSTVTALQPFTWLLQVMPLFFVAGGFSNLTVWRSMQRRGGGYADYLHGRLVRLARPALIFAVLVAAALLVLQAVGVDADLIGLAGGLLGQPLWFLGVYVIVMALAPTMAAWHARQPIMATLTLLLASVGVDQLRMAGFELIGYLNIALVWLFAQQLGFWYADGRLSALSPRTLWAVLGGSAAALVLLTGPGPYPVSMVGLPGEMSNMAPPSIAMLVLTIGQAAAVVWARPRLAAWLSRPRVWASVVGFGSLAMTIYLWHLAVLVGALGTMLRLGLPIVDPGTSWWWITRPAWLVALAVILLPLALAMSRLEDRPTIAPRNVRSPKPRSPLPGLAAALVSGGLLGYVVEGLTPSGMFLASTVLAIGGLWLSASVQGDRHGLKGEQRRAVGV